MTSIRTAIGIRSLSRWSVLPAVLCIAAVVGTVSPSFAAWAPFVTRNVPATLIARRAVTLAAGYTYEIKTVAGSGVDPVTHVLDGTNFEVAWSDDGFPYPSRDSLVSYTPASTGTYYVVVRSFSTFTSGTGNIQLRSKPPGGSFSSWSTIATGAFFGGNVVAVADALREYWTVQVQPVAGGTSDTILYTMDIGLHITKYDDDSAWVSGEILRPERRTRVMAHEGA